MISIETLLRTDEGSFVTLDEATDVRGGRGHGRDYVEGCLVLRAEGKHLLGAAEWTDVDWLWSFLLDGVDAVAARRSFETAFPDMPLSLAFQVVERHGHRDLVAIQVDGSGGRSRRLGSTDDESNDQDRSARQGREGTGPWVFHQDRGGSPRLRLTPCPVGA